MPPGPNITLAQLASVRAVVRTGSVTQAAHDLFRTQSAVTQQIRLLERELGCSLFVRRGRRIETTPEGRDVAHHAEDICDRVEALKAHVAKRLGKVQGLLRIGCGTQTAIRILPILLNDFIRRHPRVEVEVVETQSDQLPALLLQGHIDVGMGLRSAVPSRVVFERIFEDPFVFACSRRHPLARAGSVGPQEIAALPLIRYRHGMAIQETIEHQLRDLHLKPAKSIEVSSTESMLTLVRRNLGVALVPGYIIRLLKPKGVVMLPFEPYFTVEYGVYRYRRRFSPPAQKAFIAYVKAHGAETLGLGPSATGSRGDQSPPASRHRARPA